MYKYIHKINLAITFLIVLMQGGGVEPFEINKIPEHLKGLIKGTNSAVKSNNIKSRSQDQSLYEYEKLELELESTSNQQDENLYQVSPKLMLGGTKISASFNKTTLRDVIRSLAQKSKINIVLSPQISGEVTARFIKVPSRDALRSIIQAHKVYYIAQRNVFQFVTEDEYRIFAAKHLTETRVYKVSWASLVKAVSAIKPYITRGVGKISVNARTSRMLVSDLRPRLNRIEKVLMGIEIENPQILITARIIEINYTDSSDVGTFFNITEQNTGKQLLSTTYVSGQGLLSQSQGGLLINAIFDDIFIPSPDFPKSIELRMAAIGVNGEVNIVSSPRVLVTANTKSLIQVGQEIPYPTSSTNANGQIISTFQFLDAGTKLEILPQVVDKVKKKIRIQLKIENSAAQLLKFNEEGTLQAPQKSLTRTNLTTVCRSGQTLLIAGFINYLQVDEKVGIPILKEIPIIDFLFSNKVKRLEKREIAILITPKILDNRGTPIKRIYKRLFENAEANE